MLEWRFKFLKEVFPEENEEYLHSLSKMDYLAQNWAGLPWRTYLDEQIANGKISPTDLKSLYIPVPKYLQTQRG